MDNQTFQAAVLGVLGAITSALAIVKGITYFKDRKEKRSNDKLDLIRSSISEGKDHAAGQIESLEGRVKERLQENADKIEKRVELHSNLNKQILDNLKRQVEITGVEVKAHSDTISELYKKQLTKNDVVGLIEDKVLPIDKKMDLLSDNFKQSLHKMMDDQGKLADTLQSVATDMSSLKGYMKGRHEKDD